VVDVAVEHDVLLLHPDRLVSGRVQGLDEVVQSPLDRGEPDTVAALVDETMLRGDEAAS